MIRAIRWYTPCFDVATVTAASWLLSDIKSDIMTFVLSPSKARRTHDRTVIMCTISSTNPYKFLWCNLENKQRTCNDNNTLLSGICDRMDDQEWVVRLMEIWAASRTMTTAWVGC